MADLCDDCFAVECECDEIEELGLCLHCRRAYNRCERDYDECDCPEETVEDFVSTITQTISGACLLEIVEEDDAYLLIANSESHDVVASYNTDTCNHTKAHKILEQVKETLIQTGLKVCTDCNEWENFCK